MKYINFLIFTLVFGVSFGLQAYKVVVINRTAEPIDVRAYFTVLVGGGWKTIYNILPGKKADIKGATGHCLDTAKVRTGGADPVQVRYSKDADQNIWHDFAAKDKGLTACRDNHITVKTVYGGTAFKYE